MKNDLPLPVIEQVTGLSLRLTQEIDALKNSVRPPKPIIATNPTAPVVIEGCGTPESKALFAWEREANSAIKALRERDPDLGRMEGLRSTLNRYLIPEEDKIFEEPFSREQVSLIVKVLNQDRCYPDWNWKTPDSWGGQIGYRRVQFSNSWPE